MKKELSHIARMVEQGREVELLKSNRRLWLQNMAAVAGTGAMMWACGKDDDDADANTATAADPVTDGGYLNAALALEHEAIAIYTIAAGLKPFTEGDKPYAAFLTIAGSFLEHHKGHRDSLIAAIADLKTQNAKVADAVKTKTDAEYVTALGGDAAVALLNGSASDAYLSGIVNILRLAAVKEKAASDAYRGLILSFTSKLSSGTALAAIDAELAIEEAAHYGVLRAGLIAILGDADSGTAGTVIPGALPSVWTAQKGPA